MNNESVKRCREKKKQEYEALRTGYKKQEEELRTAKKEMEKLKAMVMKLQAATHAPATTNDNANENLVKTLSTFTTSAIEQTPSLFAGCRGNISQGDFARQKLRDSEPQTRTELWLRRGCQA